MRDRSRWLDPSLLFALAMAAGAGTGLGHGRTPAARISASIAPRGILAGGCGLATQDHSLAEPSALFSRLPLAFVENDGQWPTQARFVARRGGMQARLEEQGLLLQVESPDSSAGVLVKLGFEGASADSRLEGEGPLPGLYHFFFGRDPAGWRTQVPSFSSVRYRGLYEGLDLLVREEAGRLLEYDLALQPGAKLSRFAVRCEGMERLSLEPDGSLILWTRLGALRQAPPEAWTETPEGRKAPVECRFRILTPDAFGLEAPLAPPGSPLHIDPGLEWSTFLGGGFQDAVLAMRADAQGNLVLAGASESLDFPVTAGSYDSTHNGAAYDAVVTKLNPTGTALLFSTFLGGSEFDGAASLAVSTSGEVTVGGGTRSTDFPTSPGAFDTTLGNGEDGFIARLDPAGSSLLFCTYLGGTNGFWGDSIEGLALDESTGEVIAVGLTDSPDFPTTPGAFQPTLGVSCSPPFGCAGSDAYVTRLNSTGTGLVFSTFLGGSTYEGAHSVVLDSLGEALVVGYSGSIDFPTTPGAFSNTLTGASDIFLSRLDPTGSALTYSTLLGGSFPSTTSTPQSDAFAIALDGAGEVTIAGWTDSGSFPTTTGAFQPTFGGNFDVFVSRFRLLGSGPNDLVWSTYLGGSGVELPWDLALDSARNVVLAGRVVTSPDFPATPGAFMTAPNSSGDVFVAMLDSAGSRLFYSTRLGGSGYYFSGEEDGFALALDTSGSAVVAGRAISADFPITSGAYDPAFGGLTEGFVTRLDLLPQGASRYGSGTPGCAGQLVIGVTSWAQVGNSSFAITCGSAPGNATGLLGFGGAPLATPFVILGAQVWIDLLSPPSFFVVVSSNAIGAAEVAIPIPQNAALASGQVVAQCFWVDPCAPAGVSASSALVLVVQP
jgi:hypothetical protein